MIQPPSVQKDYSFIYSGDPALDLPAIPDEVEGEDPEARKLAVEKAIADREAVLARARETGQWQALVRAGETPTIFTLHPLGTAYDWWCGEVKRRSLCDSEAALLVVRLALRQVDNFGKYKVEPTSQGGQALAKNEVIDAIYAEAGDAGRLIILELANHVIERATTPLRPKSR